MIAEGAVQSTKKLGTMAERKAKENFIKMNLSKRQGKKIKKQTANIGEYLQRMPFVFYQVANIGKPTTYANLLQYHYMQFHQKRQ